MQGVSKGTEKEERQGTGSDLYPRFKTRNYRVLYLIGLDD
jgi:hypothetical protein